MGSAFAPFKAFVVLLQIMVIEGRRFISLIPHKSNNFGKVTIMRELWHVNYTPD